MVVTREAGDRVVVTWHYDGGHWLKAVASMAQGGNIVEYASDDKTDETFIFTMSGQYTWAQDHQRNWYLTSYRAKRYDGKRKRPSLDYLLEVSEFSSAPEIAPNRFEFASFNLPPGTTVEEGGRKNARRFKVGADQKPGVQLQSALEALGHELKKRGFASPERGKPGGR